MALTNPQLELWQRLIDQPADKLPTVDGDLSAAQAELYNAIALEQKQGQRNKYWAISNPSGGQFAAIPHLKATSRGIELWGNESEDNGEFKMGLTFDTSVVNALRTFEALVMRKLAVEFASDDDAQCAAHGDTPDISTEFGLKAKVTLVASRNTRSLCDVSRKFIGGTIRVSTKCILDTDPAIGVPRVDKRPDPDTGKHPSSGNSAFYNFGVTLRPTIVKSNKVQWEVRKLVVGNQSSDGGAMFRPAVSLKSLQTAEWKLDHAPTKGQHANAFHKINHSLSSNQSYADPFWIHGLDAGDRPVPCKVGMIWPNLDHPERDITLVVSEDPTKFQAVDTICVNIQSAIEVSEC